METIVNSISYAIIMIAPIIALVLITAIMNHKWEIQEKDLNREIKALKNEINSITKQLTH